MLLPEPLGAYFAAKNKHDIGAMLTPFAADAVVKDEGQEIRGHDAIRAWMEETTRKYGVTVEVKKADEKVGDVVVGALVSGNFPGSPATIRYAFTIKDREITRLEIG